MFGESDSESPRLPSPWDSVISSPQCSPSSIPQLVPEAEEVSLTSSSYLFSKCLPQGNVEYKLQLLAPSPARFARLVTQMKWRLLEGGGQAYYELGVADNGALIGLPRPELEQSLETLDMMAGEIGASVIVVKEIEVPAIVAGTAGYDADRRNDKWRRQKAARNSATEDIAESEPDHNIDDDPDPTIGQSSTSSDLDLSQQNTDFTDISQHTYLYTNCIDSKPDLSFNVDNDHPDLEITSVFKPRRTHPRHHQSISPRNDPIDRTKKKKPPDAAQSSKARETGFNQLHRNKTPHAVCKRNFDPTVGTPQRRTSLPHPTAHPAGSMENSPSLIDTHLIPELRLEGEEIGSPSEIISKPGTHSQDPSLNDSRLIVEVLVVRKMSVDGAFLDFSGFSLS
jgi:hypothetical protein